jgi:hypothetical protein
MLPGRIGFGAVAGGLSIAIMAFLRCYICAADNPLRRPGPLVLCQRDVIGGMNRPRLG